MRKLVFTLMALFVVFTLLRVYADTKQTPVVGAIQQVQVQGQVR